MNAAVWAVVALIVIAAVYAIVQSLPPDPGERRHRANRRRPR